VTDDSGSSISRRRLLRLGSVVGAASIAGCGQRPSEPDDTTTTTSTATADRRTDATETSSSDAESKTPYDARFSRVVDVAAEGGDATGTERINDIIESNLEDDTLFYFPSGTYRISGMLVVQHYENVGFYGENAVLRPADGQRGSWWFVDDVSRFLLEGVTLSNEAPQTGVRMKIHVTGGENVIRDVTVAGFHDVDTRTHAFTLQVNGSETSLNLVRVSMADGAENGTAVYVHPSEDPGTLRLQDCEIVQWNEQGLYGSAHGGPMYVVGGRYANNGMAQVRVGGGNEDTPGVIRDVTVEVDDPYPAGRKGNIRGIWLNEGENTLVENCDVSITGLSNHGSSGAIVVGPEHGSATIRNTNVTVDDSTFALALTKPKQEGFVIPGLDHPPRNWKVRAENLTIAGEAADGIGIWVVDRPGCTFRDVAIDQSGANRDGIGLLRSSRTTFTGLSCVTGGYPIATSFGPQSDVCDLVLENLRDLRSRSIESSSGSAVVTKRDERYCLERNEFDVTEDRPVIGLTHLEDAGIHTALLPESRLKPY